MPGVRPSFAGPKVPIATCVVGDIANVGPPLAEARGGPYRAFRPVGSAWSKDVRSLAPDVDRRRVPTANGDLVVQEARDVHPDSDTAVRRRVPRRRDVTVDRVSVRVVEPNRVVHRAERDLNPAGLERQSLEIPVGGDGVSAATAVRIAEVVPAA